MIKYRKQLKIFNFALLPVTGSLQLDMLRRVQWTGYNSSRQIDGHLVLNVTMSGQMTLFSTKVPDASCVFLQ